MEDNCDEIIDFHQQESSSNITEYIDNSQEQENGAREKQEESNTEKTRNINLKQESLSHQENETDTSTSENDRFSEKEPYCLLKDACKGEKSIVILNEQRLQTCKKILEVRIKDNLAHKNVILPEEPNSFSAFHKDCYQRFTGLPKKQRKALKENSEMQTSKEKKVFLRSSSSPAKSSSSGVLARLCLFCGKNQKKHLGEKQKLVSAATTNFESNVKKYAELLEDQKMLAKIMNVDFVAKEVSYHGICRVQYQKSAELSTKQDSPPQSLSFNQSTFAITSGSNWHKERNVHKESFEVLTSYLDENVLQDKKVLNLSDVKKQYEALLKEIGGNEFLVYSSTASKLEKKITEHYGDKIKISKGKTKQGCIVYSSDINYDNAIRTALNSGKETSRLKEVAYLLREAILSEKETSLPENLKVADIMKGEVQIPSILAEFLNHLIGGPDSRRGKTDQKLRRINSIAADIVYTATSGRKKPAKHLKLGLAMKSMTGSRKVLEVLNRMGHCASYNTIEELETELTYNMDENFITPEDIKPGSHLGTGVAFDNFDRFVETLSGKDTLHDTVGIVYQYNSNVYEGEPNTSEVIQASTNKNLLKRRRTYEATGLDIEPFKKKPKISPLLNTISTNSKAPQSYVDAVKRDLIWLFDLYFNPSSTPMWSGWNSNFLAEESHTYKISYLPQINQSPTSLSVVKETLERAKRIAVECGKKSICVTYDLAIASPAFRIQASEAPAFDNIFINLGAFHIEMAFFSAIGKYIAESGGPYLLNECHIIEKGSLRGFISGKNYNRCKRVHQLFAAALEKLHFQQFICQSDPHEIALLRSESKNLSDNFSKEMSIPESIENTLSRYEEFRKQTRDGKHGMTAKYWFQYIEMIHVYHEFSRSIRSGCFDLFCHCLPKIASYFFAFNHQNYARWITLFESNLHCVKYSHPDLYEEFKNGNFTIERTKKAFSRTAIDLTLEQTINADAASQRTGITAMTNSISARQRWAKMHHISATVLTNLFQEMGLDRSDDNFKDLRPKRIQKNCEDINKLTDCIKNAMDPFSKDINSNHLFNIASAKAANEETKSFLINVKEIGDSSRTKFIKECISEPNRFEQRIPRQKLRTFACDGKVFKVNAENKTIAVRMERDLFGSILFLALQRKVDMSLVMTYPLTPVPLSLCHVDGLMNQTPKSTLLNELARKLKPEPPSWIDITIVDGMFFLHLLNDLPASFGSCARVILVKLCSLKSQRIDIVFDRVIRPSIKDTQRDKRSSDDRTTVFNITGPTQKRPINFLQALRNDSFKESLVSFLIQQWEDDSLSTVIGDKHIYAKVNKKCYCFKVSSGKVIKEEVPMLYSEHEEADSNMIFHLHEAPANKNIVIRASDTDVLIILLGNFHLIDKTKNVWMETGLLSRNTLQYININRLHSFLGESFSKSLPTFHALTGSDYTASFSRKGKIKPLKHLKDNEDLQVAFADFGKGDHVTEKMCSAAEKFVCLMYGNKKLGNVNELRHLKEELKELREKGVPEGQDEAYGRVCKRCRTPLGVVFNSGALCPNCEKKVCKNCRVNITHKEDAKNLPQWFCTYCAKIRDIKAESGAWFYDSKVQIDKKRKIYGSLLLKRLFTSRVKKSDNLIFKDPNWEDIIEERDEDLEDIDADDNGYVLVTPNSSGDFTVKEGNISQLLSSKAVVGLEGAHLMRKSQYDLLLQEEKSENESQSNNSNNAMENKPAKTLAQLAQHEEEENYVTTNNHDEEYYNDKESTTTNINTLPTDTSLYNDAYSTEQYIEKRESSSSSSDEEDDDKVSVGDDDKATEKENDVNIQQNDSNENEAEDFNLVAGSEDNRDDIEEDIASSESEEVVKIERKNLSEEEFECFNKEINQYQKRKIFIDEIQENVFEGQRPKYQERKSSSESEDEMEKLFDFKSMEKQGPVKSHQYVQQNDLDLKDLQKTFVLKKNVCVTKMKTDEHEETSSESSLSSDDEIDDDFEIPQVVAERKHSSEEELERLNNVLIQHREERNFVFDIQENVFEGERPKIQERKSFSESEDEIEKMFDFKSMEKQGSVKSHQFVQQNDLDLRDLQKTFVLKKNVCVTKMKTDEHDETSSESSSSSDDETDDDFEILQVVAERKHSSEEELERLNNDLIQHQEERNFVFDIQENVFEGERPKFQERKSSSESEDEMEKLFDFKSMEKQGSVKSHQYVQQNDLDLKDLQKTFVLKKNVCVMKMKTDEHEETSSESSSSSDDEIDDEFEISQVVLDRRNSSEEEFENLNMDLSKKLLQKQNIMEVEETVLEKPAKMENHEDVRKISSSSSDSELEIDFKAMQNIADLNFQAGDADKVSDDDEDVQFLSMAAYSKTKIKKFRTDEHSDQEISSSSDEEIASTFSSLKKKKKLHAEEEDLDSYFTEYKQTKDVSGSVDSLGSNYSNEGDFNELSSVAGEVFVGFRYDHNASRFEVQVHRAKDLPAADPKKNTTDPYAKVYLDPEPSKKGGKRKTKVKKHALNPEFDEVLEFNNIDYEEVITRSCLVSIWHHGMKHIKLGEVRINLEEFIQSGFSLLDPAPQWYTLSQATVRKEQVKFVGDLFIKLHYKTPSTQLASTKKQQTKLPNPTKGELNIHVVSAKSLGREGDTNPFCKVEIFSKDIIGAPKMKTSSISNSKDPWWSETFVVPNVSWSHLENSVIQFSIWHFEKGKSHQLVGGVRIGLGKIQNGVEHDSFGEEVKTWKNFLDHPNEILEYTLPIRSTLESVKNEVIPPTESVKIISDDDHYKIKASKKESSASQTSFAKRFLNADTISLASSGSMLSIYSDAGGQRSDLVITGEILFSMKHDQDSGIFSVTVEKAKGIAAVNAKAQTSDPYVKVYLLPDKNKDSKKKTLHRRKTVNPEWHETVKYKINREELLKRTLQLAIWNHDRFGRNDFLGEVQINMKHYARSNELSKADPVWYTLQEAAPISIGDSTDKKGELTLCLKYVNDTLTVLIKEASNLTAADENKLSNPFVKCYLLPDKSRKSKRKTSIQKKTVNPVWNDKFEYSNVFENDLQSRVLEITVWDHDSSGHQFLGGLRCGSSHGDEYWHDCYDNEVTIWEAMIKHTGIFAEYSIPLRPTMVSKKGQINQVIPMITEELEKQRVNTPQPQEQQVVLPPGTPQIRVGLQYIDHVTSDYDDGNKKKKNSSQLMLHIKEARNLPSRPNGETPSTLAKFYLLPKRKQKIRTDVYLKSIEPQWDAEFAVTKDVTAEELREKALEIMICDMDDEAKGKERELAYVRLGSGLGVDSWDDSTDGEIEIWKSMLTQHNRWITKVLPLRICDSSTGDSFKKKKDKSRKSRKSIGEDSEPLEDDYIPNEGENDGSESPRTSALRAMGSHASTVIEMMQSRDPEPTHMRPQEGLSPIEEDEGEETFTPPQTLQSIPSITVSQDVQPGEPPFPGAGYNADKPKTKKEPPVMSLLKRTPSMGSLTSVYSTDSANIYDQVPIRGDIQFGMRYGHKKNLFEVHVFQARDIAAVDSKKGISDPYCKVYLLPDKTKSGKKKTKTRKKTLNPEWEEILEFSISIRDLRTRTLWLAVWHQERLGRNIFLGEVMLNMDILVDEGSQLEVPTPKWYTLCEKGSPPMVDLYKGFLKISVMFEDEDLMRRGGKAVMDYDDDSSKKKKKKKKKKEKQEGKGKIHLHLKEANDLPAADKDGLSDPFCKCYLLPLKPAKSKRKTPVIRHTRDPVWDFQTEYNVDYEDLPDLGLELTIWDWDRGVKNDFLGCARLNLGSRSGTWDDAEGEELLAWQHLIDEPNKWKDFTIPLRSKLDFRSVKR